MVRKSAATGATLGNEAVLPAKKGNYENKELVRLVIEYAIDMDYAQSVAERAAISKCNAIEKALEKSAELAQLGYKPPCGTTIKQWLDKAVKARRASRETVRATARRTQPREHT